MHARTRALLTVAIVAAGCGSSAPHPRIVVDKPRALVDTPIAIRVTGLGDARRVTISAHATDAFHETWHSHATFRPREGTVDLRTSPSQGGTYEGAQPMGLLTSMRPAGVTDPEKAGTFVPSRETHVAIRVTVNGRTVVRRTIERLALLPSVKLTRARPASEGFFGDFFASPSEGRRPAVVTLGGSEGGIGTVDIARLLASHGYPSLALAYFKEPGLPKRIARIPLEYFVGALSWLRRRPEVDPKRIVMLGVSAGTVAAMLTAMHFPKLVHGLVVYAPSGVVLGTVDRHTPPWTLRGRPLPFVKGPIDPLGSGPAATRLHPENVNGSVMMVSGAADALIPASDFASVMWARMGGTYSKRKADVWRNYPYAGHGVGGAIPYLPAGTVFEEAPGEALAYGGTAEATADARADSWPRLLAFLAKLNG